MKRRTFGLGLAATFAAHAFEQVPDAVCDVVGEPLARRIGGGLDIHHIATGRGNSTLLIGPGDTSILIDAGASADGLDVSAAPRPDSGRRPGEWIARYVQRRLSDCGTSGLDYMVVTHLHPDHLGDVTDQSPRSAHGEYRLSGVTDVAELLPIGALVDRAYPAYDYPMAWEARFATNYVAYVRSRVGAGGVVQRVVAGSNDQIRPTRPRDAKANFEVRNIVANGVVWTGAGQSTRTLFPPLSQIPREDFPTENMCSIGLRVKLGNFAYFTGGDLTSYSFDGELPWHDVLTPSARVAGGVDVATADHHGLFDGLNADVVRALRPQAWVIPTWHISQPDTLQLERMLSERLYAGPRDVFATDVMPQNKLANARLMRRLRSTEGHVIVRVSPSGSSFTIVVTDNHDERDTVLCRFGPYASRGGGVS